MRDAVFKLMRFWLDRGCDGFRVRVRSMFHSPSTFVSASCTKMAPQTHTESQPNDLLTDGRLDGRDQYPLEGGRAPGRSDYGTGGRIPTRQRTLRERVSVGVGIDYRHTHLPVAFSRRPRIHEYLNEMNEKVLSSACLISPQGNP